MNYTRDFETIELLLNSKCVTRGVDAFSLALIKADKQLRKLFTHLIYQYPAIQKYKYDEIRNVLGDNSNVYTEGIIKGIDSIYKIKVEEIFGKEYSKYRTHLTECFDIRNKIFHGQLTKLKLSTEDLIDLTDGIKIWCSTLGNNFIKEIGYDGFKRNSLQVSSNIKFDEYKIHIDSLEEYRNFIKTLTRRHIMLNRKS